MPTHLKFLNRKKPEIRLRECDFKRGFIYISKKRCDIFYRVGQERRAITHEGRSYCTKTVITAISKCSNPEKMKICFRKIKDKYKRCYA